MWVALRTLEESAALSRRMADHARAKGYRIAFLRYSESDKNKLQRADDIRRILTADLPKTNPEGSVAERSRTGILSTEPAAD
jgi:hypothetical protein